jgi:hypothetical protein
VRHSKTDRPWSEFDRHVIHKIDQAITSVMSRDGVSLLEATRRAFRENSALGKSAPPRSYEDLVGAEMAKGCTMEVAAQRVMQAHGSNAVNAGTKLHQRAGVKMHDGGWRIDLGR